MVRVGQTPNAQVPSLLQDGEAHAHPQPPRFHLEKTLELHGPWGQLGAEDHLLGSVLGRGGDRAGHLFLTVHFLLGPMGVL